MNLKLAAAAVLALNFSQAFANEAQDLFDANKDAYYTGRIARDGSECSMKFEENGFAHITYNKVPNGLWLGAENLKSLPFTKPLVYQYGGPWEIGCIITGNYCQFTRWEMWHENFNVTKVKWSVNGQTVMQCDFEN